MFKIIDKRGKGKTMRGLLLAKETDSIFVSSCVDYAADMCHRLGIGGRDIVSYARFMNNKGEFRGKSVFIDDADSFLRYVVNANGEHLVGFSMTEEDEYSVSQCQTFHHGIGWCRV